MKPQISLRQAFADRQLLGNALPGATWKPWRTLLIAANGEQLVDAEERTLFKQLTGRERESLQLARILAAAVGRRGGKSSAVGCYGAYRAALVDYSDVLARGEKGVLLVVATDVAVAGIVKDRCAAALEGSPILKQLIVRQDDTTIELSNNISIECHPCSFRRLRGRTYIGAILDELAFWYQDSNYANPDTEVLASIRPGLLTTGGPMLLVSSVYNNAGVLHDTWRKFYGVDNPNTLVAYGTSKDFNASLPQADIDQALEEDYARNAAELLSIWRSDLETYVQREAVEACVSRGVFERAPIPGISYHAFVDPAGGSGGDSMTLCIGHVDHIKQIVIVDAIREAKPHFSPEVVTGEFATLLKSYNNIYKVVGDKYAGGYPPEQFGKFNVLFDRVPSRALTSIKTCCR